MALRTQLDGVFIILLLERQRPLYHQHALATHLHSLDGIVIRLDLHENL